MKIAISTSLFAKRDVYVDARHLYLIVENNIILFLSCVLHPTIILQ